MCSARQKSVKLVLKQLQASNLHADLKTFSFDETLEAELKTEKYNRVFATNQNILHEE